MSLNIAVCTILLGYVQWPSPAAAVRTPLTEITPEPEELAGFANTVSGAISRLQVAVPEQLPVIHIVGASSVERAVDWSPVCARHGGARIVLIGPQVGSKPDEDNSVQSGSSGCYVEVVEGLFSTSLVRDVLGVGDPAAQPDMYMLHNADVYMPYWRRTLAELLQLRRPIVLTVYCEYEIHKVDRMLRWSELEFTVEAFAECDAMLAKSFSRHVDQHAATGAGAVPEPRTLWDFEPNPYAHESPRNCYSEDIMKGEMHGVRNAYWTAFTGAAAVPTNGGREL